MTKFELMNLIKDINCDDKKIILEALKKNKNNNDSISINEILNAIENKYWTFTKNRLSTSLLELNIINNCTFLDLENYKEIFEYAIDNNNHKVIYYITHNIKILNSIDDYSYILASAIKKKNQILINYILTNFVNKVKDFTIVVISAVAQKNIEIINIIKHENYLLKINDFTKLFEYLLSRKENDLIDFILNNKCLINSKSNFTEILICATIEQNNKVVDYIFNNIKDLKNLERVFAVALDWENKYVIKYFKKKLKIFLDSDYNFGEILYYAISKTKDHDIVDWVLKNKLKNIDDFEIILIESINTNNQNVIKYIFKNSLYLKKIRKFNEVLYNAIKKKNLFILNQFKNSEYLKSKILKEKNGYLYPLLASIQVNDDQMIKFILENESRLNTLKYKNFSSYFDNPIILVYALKNNLSELIDIILSNKKYFYAIKKTLKTEYKNKLLLYVVSKFGREELINEKQHIDIDIYWNFTYDNKFQLSTNTIDKHYFNNIYFGKIKTKYYKKLIYPKFTKFQICEHKGNILNIRTKIFEQCIICINECKTEVIRFCTNDHLFCNNCVNQWIYQQEKNTCPLCRKNSQIEYYDKLYLFNKLNFTK